MQNQRLPNPLTKLLRSKKVDKELNLKVTQNDMSGRIFVEFSSGDGKLVAQRSFPDTHEGKKESTEFQKKFKSITDLKKHFGLITKEKKNVVK